MRDFWEALKANIVLLLALGAVYAGLLAVALFVRGGAFSPKPVDVVFCFDTTSSMSEEIVGTLEAAEQFADILSREGVDCQFGLVTFGDQVRGIYGTGGQLTSSVAEFKAWLSLQSAIGGGDAPENQLEALNTASRMRFRPGARHVIVLVSDAPYHYAEDGSGVCNRTLASVQQTLVAHSVACFVVSVPMEDYIRLASATGGAFFDIHGVRSFSQIIVQLGYAIARSVLD